MDLWLAPPTAELELPDLKLDLGIELLTASEVSLPSPALSGRSSIVSDHTDHLSSSYSSPDLLLDFSSGSSSSSSSSSCDGDYAAAHVHEADCDGDFAMGNSCSLNSLHAELFSSSSQWSPHDPVLFQHEAYNPLMPALYSHHLSYTLSRVPQLPPGPPAISSFDTTISFVTPQTFSQPPSRESSVTIPCREQAAHGSPESTCSSILSELDGEDEEEQEEQEEAEDEDMRDASPSYSDRAPSRRIVIVSKSKKSPAAAAIPALPPLPPFTSFSVLPPLLPTLPADPSVVLALSRRLNSLASSNLPFSPSRKGGNPPKSRAPQAPQVDRRKSAKRPLELFSACWTCGDEIAKLVLRGTNGSSLDNFAPKVSFNCTLCVPVLEEEHKIEAGGELPGYESTISARIDELQGFLPDPILSQPKFLALGEIKPEMKDDALVCESFGMTERISSTNMMLRIFFERRCVFVRSRYRRNSTDEGELANFHNRNYLSPL